MTRKEAIASYEKLYDYIVGDDDTLELDYGEFMELNHYIRSALRPVSREQVEKVWRVSGLTLTLEQAPVNVLNVVLYKSMKAHFALTAAIL